MSDNLDRIHDRLQAIDLRIAQIRNGQAKGKIAVWMTKRDRVQDEYLAAASNPKREARG